MKTKLMQQFVANKTLYRLCIMKLQRIVGSREPLPLIENKLYRQSSSVQILIKTMLWALLRGRKRNTTCLMINIKKIAQAVTNSKYSNNFMWQHLKAFMFDPSKDVFLKLFWKPHVMSFQTQEALWSLANSSSSYFWLRIERSFMGSDMRWIYWFGYNFRFRVILIKSSWDKLKLFLQTLHEGFFKLQSMVTLETSSQKLRRCASRRVRSVWKSLGQVTFGWKKFGPKILAHLQYTFRKYTFRK